jgi:hypothetical protein
MGKSVTDVPGKCKIVQKRDHLKNMHLHNCTFFGGGGTPDQSFSFENGRRAVVFFRKAVSVNSSPQLRSDDFRRA